MSASRARHGTATRGVNSLNRLVGPVVHIWVSRSDLLLCGERVLDQRPPALSIKPDLRPL